MQPRTSGSSDVFSRRVEAAVPEALDLLPRYGWSERSARVLVERVLAAADQAVPMSPEHEWHRQYLQREAAEGRAERAEAELARLRAVEEALRRVEQLTRPRLDLTQLHELARSALSEPAADHAADEGLVAPVARCLAQLDGKFIGASDWRDRRQADYEERARRVLQTIANVEGGSHSGGLPLAKRETAAEPAAEGGPE